MYRLEFAPKPSKWLFFAQFILHSLALTALICSNITLIWQILLGAMLLLSGYYYCWLWALQRGSRAIVRCVMASGRWWLTDQRGYEYEAELSGESLVTTVIIILNFRVISQKSEVCHPGNRPRGRLSGIQAVFLLGLFPLIEKLHFQVVGARIFAPRPRLILCPDSLDADTLRRLRVWLLSH